MDNSEIASGKSNPALNPEARAGAAGIPSSRVTIALYTLLGIAMLVTAWLWLWLVYSGWVVAVLVGIAVWVVYETVRQPKEQDSGE